MNKCSSSGGERSRIVGIVDALVCGDCGKRVSIFSQRYRFPFDIGIGKGTEHVWSLQRWLSAVITSSGCLENTH
jgi:hypothetical protein